MKDFSVWHDASIAHLVDAVMEVFGVMLGMEISVDEPYTSSATSRRCEVKGTIGLTGDLTGVLALNMSRESASRAVQNLLGLDGDRVDQSELVDAVGEMSNMIAGGWKTRLSDDAGVGVEISLPMVSIGDDYVVEAAGSNSALVIPFHGSDDTTFIELIVANPGSGGGSAPDMESTVAGKEMS
jgi:chemotaxis protein CheX